MTNTQTPALDAAPIPKSKNNHYFRTIFRLFSMGTSEAPNPGVRAPAPHLQYHKNIHPRVSGASASAQTQTRAPVACHIERGFMVEILIKIYF